MKRRDYTASTFPRSRLATFDIGAVGKKKHYVTALLEFDVTEARKKLKIAKEAGGAKISFTGWLLKSVGEAVSRHKEVAAFRKGRRKIVVFDDVNISIIVEKVLEGRKVPIPLVIRKVQEKSAADITAEIETAKTEDLSGERIVLARKTGAAERAYYFLPGAVRRAVWRGMLRSPRLIYWKMGNVGVTSLGTIAKVSGWFVQTSVHPLSIGVGAIVPKPVAADGGIRVGEILHLTLLIDHNAVDGGPMARFINSLRGNIEGGIGLEGEAPNDAEP